jgi:8-amino-7-oxononanoate synthase
MLDFTSSLYLGLHHPSHSLAPWTRLTTGKPAALDPPPHATRVARALATLQGCESATLFPSTLHLFFDLLETLRRDRIHIYVDAAAYPIACWAVQRLAAFGVPAHRLPHFDGDAAREIIAAGVGSGRRPVILVDGYCVTCGRPAPLRSYVESVTPRHGWVVLDDTQALGIWGRCPGPRRPYGTGGGGLLPWHGIRSPRVVVGASLAKGFGVPVATLGGSASLIGRVERCGATRVHTSPPSLAILNAAERALAVNARYGDALRHRLMLLVTRFRKQLQGRGLKPPPGGFPVQAFALPRHADSARLQQALSARKITAALISSCDGAPRLAVVVTAQHQTRDIEQAADALVEVLGLACDKASWQLTA